ncbi:hypothetical protein AGR8A_pAt20023 [Agrobacterium fabrum str. J-07]|nr:hypothetical protein AGR8A_pAt20023 [Agrobacterium fabrum str. J-07]
MQEKYNWAMALFNDVKRDAVGLDLRMAYGKTRG